MKGGHKCEQDLRERGFSPARLQLFRSAFPYEQGNSLMMMCSWDSDDDHLLKEIFKKKKRAPRGQKKAEPKPGEKRKRVTKPASKAKATKLFSEKLKQSIRLGPMREGEEKIPFALRELHGSSLMRRPGCSYLTRPTLRSTIFSTLFNITMI